jgi:hypothetical protein
LNNQERLYEGQKIVMNDEWQENYLSRLGDFVINLLDTVDKIPEFLAENQNFAPSDFLSSEERTELL